MGAGYAKKREPGGEKIAATGSGPAADLEAHRRTNDSDII
jgi:hypothetical protein